MRFSKIIFSVVAVLISYSAYGQTNMFEVLKTRGLMMDDDLRKMEVLQGTSCNALFCTCDGSLYSSVDLGALCQSGKLKASLRDQKLSEYKNKVLWDDSQSVAKVFVSFATSANPPKMNLAEKLFFALAEDTYKLVSNRNALGAMSCNELTCKCKVTIPDSGINEFCKQGTYDSPLRTRQLAEDNRLLTYEYAEKLTMAARLAAGKN